MYSQIRASFRDDGQFVVCGSEDQRVYIWSASPELPPNPGMFTGFRRDRNHSYESFHAHSEVVTAAVFAPFSIKRTLEETHVSFALFALFFLPPFQIADQFTTNSVTLTSGDTLS